MSTIAIALIVAFVVILSILEVPKMLKRCLYKELVLYSIFLLIGAVTGILVTLDVKVPNPSDPLALLLSPLVTVVKFILG